jgi:predicted ester cyclase
MSDNGLAGKYRAYIDCLNRQDWANLQEFVAATVSHNGNAFGLAGYCEMLAGDFRAIPDLHFDIGLLLVNEPWVACRLNFDCTPAGTLFGLPVNGRRVSFCENVFYRFENDRIVEVLSAIDKTAIEAQLG